MLESKMWFEQDKIEHPVSTDRERFGRRLLHIATEAVDDKPCDCIILSETVMN